MSKIGIIGDTHMPAVHPGYLDFCTDTFNKHGVDKIVHIGDVGDWHAISRFKALPEAPGAEDERG